MKYVLIAFVACLLGLELHSQNLDRLLHYPPYAEVKAHVESHYALPEVREGAQWHLEKRPDGYRLTIVGWKPGTGIPESHLVWDLQTSTYLPLPYPAADSVSKETPRLDAYGTMHDENVFFGYSYWAGDARSLLEPQAAQLPPRLLYQLGRAYDYLATAILDDRQDAQGPPHAFDVAYDPASIPAADLDRYDQLVQATMKTFAYVAEQQPDLEILVGYPATKLGHSAMTAWLDLNIVGHPKRAAPYLKLCQYAAGLISHAHNLLASCPPKAILFTNGDTDTYPLYYLQAHKGFRKDVSIVNLSLLNTGRYLHFLRATKRVRLSLPDAVYRDPNYGYLLATPFADAVDAGKLLDSLREAVPQPGGAIPYGSLTLHPGKKAGQNARPLSLAARSGQYYLKQDLAVIDLLVTNAWKRPVCFSHTVDASGMLDLGPYLSYNGLVMVLEPQPCISISGGVCMPDPMANYRLFTEAFVYDGINPAQPWISNASFDANLRRNFEGLAMALTQSDDAQEEVMQLLGIYLRVFPPTPGVSEPGQIPLIPQLHTAGFADAAKAFLDNAYSWTVATMAEWRKDKAPLDDYEAAKLEYYFRLLPGLLVDHRRPADGAEIELLAKEYRGL